MAQFVAPFFLPVVWISPCKPEPATALGVISSLKKNISDRYMCMTCVVTTSTPRMAS